jgi:K+-sensing histidine kinase KdpD
MRSIPGTITEYVAGQDQVELLDLTPDERAARIKAAKVAEAQRKANEALAELRAAQAGA